jgi:hypothetical protein
VHLKNYFFFSFWKEKENNFLTDMGDEVQMYVWDVNDLFGDSLYSFNVRERLMREATDSDTPTWLERLFAGKERKKYRFKRLYDFSLIPWIDLFIQNILMFFLHRKLKIII